MERRLGPEVVLRPGACIWQVLQALCPDDDDDRARHAALREAFRRGEPFHALELPLVDCSAPGVSPLLRWWSMSARPWAEHAAGDIGWVGVMTDITSTRQTKQVPQQEAERDSLTGLATRDTLLRRLMCLRRGARAAAPRLAALLMLDLDHFKAVNDNWGHAAGDAVLVGAAARLRASLRDSDLAVRLGGDEFVLLVEDAGSPDQLQRLGDRIVARLREAYSFQGTQLFVGASVGIAIVPAQPPDPSELLAAADMALYAAKSAGRGSVAIYDEQLATVQRRRRQLQADLPAALVAGAIRLTWQHQTATRDGTLLRVKAAAQWSHPEWGSVLHDEIVALSQNTVDRLQLRNWLLRQAGEAALALPAHVGLAVDASTGQLEHAGFAAQLQHLVAALGGNTSRLQVDLDARELGRLGAIVRQRLQSLAASGVQIGLTSMGQATLSRLAPAGIAISAIYVDADLLLSPGATRLVIAPIGRGLVGLARALGARTVALGLDLPAQRSFACAAGCDAMQHIGGVPTPGATAPSEGQVSCDA